MKKKVITSALKTCLRRRTDKVRTLVEELALHITLGLDEANLSEAEYTSAITFDLIMKCSLDNTGGSIYALRRTL